MTNAFKVPDSLKKIAFELGWDYAAYSGYQLPEDAPEDMIQGFNLGLHRLAGRRKEHDIYIRKWLLLRTNALRRGREVSPEITPDYLRVMNGPLCPVTLKPMTYGTGDDTDWSIDRINNDAAYAPGALVIMSTKANKAKGTRCFDEILEAVAHAKASPSNTFGGLSEKEWTRMACLAMRPCLLNERRNLVIAHCTFVPNGLVSSAAQIVQYRLLADAVGLLPGITKPMRKLGGDVGAKRYRKLMEKLVKTAPRTPQEMWPEVSPFDIWLNPQVFGMFCDWWDGLKPGEVDAVLSAGRAGVSAVAVSGSGFASWSLDTAGFAK